MKPPFPYELKLIAKVKETVLHISNKRLLTIIRITEEELCGQCPIRKSLVTD